MRSNQADERDVRVAAGLGSDAAGRAVRAPLGVAGAGAELTSQLSSLGGRVIRQRPMTLVAATALERVRVKGRVGLAVLAWQGSVPVALQVLFALVDNALLHGGALQRADAVLSVRLSVTASRQLFVDVADFSSSCSGLEDARAGAGRGSLSAFVTMQAIAELDWVVRPDAQGKTVRAVLGTGQVDR